jgi:hypothetical protein
LLRDIRERDPTKTKRANTNKGPLSSKHHSTMEAKKKITKSEEERSRKRPRENPGMSVKVLFLILSTFCGRSGAQ